jgi:hypothetical protein
MINRYYQEFVNSQIAAASQDGILSIPKEYPEVLRAGADYKALIETAGWKRLLDDLEARSNKALAALRNYSGHDPMEIKSLRDRWVEAEDSLHFVQVVAGEAVDRRNAALRDLGNIMQGVGLDMNNEDDAQAIRDFVFGSGSEEGQPNIEDINNE